MKKIVAVCFLASLALCAQAHADRFAPLETYETFSDNHDYKLEVAPQKGKVKVFQRRNKTHAQILEVELADQSPYSPEKAFISDRGAFVTVDSKGGLYSLVVYGTDGAVLAAYSLDDLLTKNEIASHVRHTVSTRRWLYGPDRPITDEEKKKHEEWRKGLAWWAKMITAALPKDTGNDPPRFNFSEDQNDFVLQTGWGKILKFEMSTGKILQG